MIQCILIWTKLVVPVVVSITVVVVTISFNNWQKRLGREQLRHQLYERRITIYYKFQQLLLELPVKHIDEIKELFDEANMARFDVPFLFEDNQQLKKYLDELCQLIKKDVFTTKSVIESWSGDLSSANDEQKATYRQNEEMYQSARLRIHNDHLPRLAQEFAPFLRLSDLSKR